tara:strand:- start:1313 stop:1522 length:210 start_codon:yes stop_codon:yes gene_type:complete
MQRSDLGPSIALPMIAQTWIGQANRHWRRTGPVRQPELDRMVRFMEIVRKSVQAFLHPYRPEKRYMRGR